MADAARRTPLYHEHKALGARLVPFAGYEMPLQYTGVSAEHEAVRTRAGLFDVSHMGELELRGEHAGSVVNYLVTNDLDRLADGQAMYTCCCNDRGTILDDLIVYKRSTTDVLVVCNASNRDKIVAHFAAAAKDHCDFADVSDEVALLALQGPAALGVLAELGAPQVSELRPFRFAAAEVAGTPVTAARTGYTGEDGAELFIEAGRAAAVWRAILQAGKAAGVVPVGLAARDTLRLEARLSLYGNDIDETTHPLEAGLAWTVKFDKADFVGKQALLQAKEQGLDRKLVGFEMVGRGIARHGYPLTDSAGERVGICTSGSPSPTLGKNIGLGYLPSELTEIGTRFAVDCRGKSVEAVVVKTPFYKRPS
ncbi:MAG: glycine cleavage system aminomethyltransferase GcvT [Polyangiaceae bacterium]